jgi:type II secretory pathway component PulJ
MTERRKRSRRGAVLLETIVALTVLATVGSAAAWMAAESMRAVNRVHERESELRRAARLLTAVSLWPREDLDRHLGRTVQGPWVMGIERTDPVVYVVNLADSAGGAVLLRTALFRPESAP